MKTVLLIIGLIGFTAINSHAQNKDCCCKKKTAYHKTHHKRLTHATARALPADQQSSPCITYTKGNIVVTECPDNIAGSNLYPKNDSIFDMNGNINYVVEKSYSGYYPDYSINSYANPGLNESMVNPRDLVVTSTAFKNYGVLPVKYTCEGEQASPPLNVTNIPAGTQSLAIVMYDTHADAKGPMTYWLMWDLDATGNIPENFVSDHESMNSAKEYGYQPVCPKTGTHYYHFKVYALDTKILAGKQTTKGTLENAMRGHILAKGELVAEYNKRLE